MNTKNWLVQYRNTMLMALFTAFVGCAFLWATNAMALTTLSQGYLTGDDVSIGSLVSTEINSADRVVATSTNNVDALLGVVIGDGSSLLTLNTGQDNQVQVATTGTIPVLVSDINGDISQGDHITASHIKGVGMKATSNTKVIGIAQGDLTPTEQTYSDENGKEQKIGVGHVLVQVNIAYYFKEPEKTLIPGAIQNIANSIAGKEANTMPIIISGAIFVITLIVVVSIIYSMIRSSIISVGRNPMSQSAIYRDVIQLSALVLVILGVALVAIYMILTRF